jgi:hypothetical protein
MVSQQRRSDSTKNLGAEIRRLATDARRILAEADPLEGDVETLLGRIDRLRASLGERNHGPVKAWLRSLRREVEAMALPMGTV